MSPSRPSHVPSALSLPVRPLLAILCGSALACGQSPPAAPNEAPQATPTETSSAPDTRNEAAAGVRTVYVPAYSHLPTGVGGDKQARLSILLSVRNVDPVNTVALTQVRYFDTYGHAVRDYLKGPRKLRPLETAEYSVDTFDESGGSGANFLVYWEGPPAAHPLLTETVMLGHMGPGFVAFTSRGTELVQPPELPTAVDAGK